VFHLDRERNVHLWPEPSQTRKIGAARKQSYSQRKATAGFTRVARYAGTRHAAVATAKKRRAAAKKVGPSVGFTSKRKPVIKRAKIHAVAAPAAIPTETSFRPCFQLPPEGRRRGFAGSCGLSQGRACSTLPLEASKSCVIAGEQFHCEARMLFTPQGAHGVDASGAAGG
jgi:hypothetical protein